MISSSYPPGPAVRESRPEPVKVAFGWCVDHEVGIGPALAESVGFEIWEEHRDCEVEVVGWNE